MTSKITKEHKQSFDDIKKKLTAVGSKEGNFLKVELLFYDAMAIARTYGEEIEENKLLAALKQLQMNEYQQTKALFKKSSQRERVIKSFVNRLKAVLSAGTKDHFYSPQASQL